jgi:hypothetical protein
MAQKRPHSPSPTVATSVSDQIYTSSKIHDRASTFIGLFTPSVAGPRKLQSHPTLKGTDHKMLAVRKPSAQRTLSASQKPIMDVWSDDDGEKYAGKHLERLLTEMEVEGCVVVGRWYGGTLLGPVRFEHIKNVAREAVELWKREQGGDVKRVKVDDGGSVQGDEKAEKEKFVTELKERDESILMLRKLLADKNAKKEEIEKSKSESTAVATSGAEGKPVASPAKQVNYDDMPLTRLKQLDKARDATIAFLLKQIDAAEQRDTMAATSENLKT